MRPAIVDSLLRTPTAASCARGPSRATTRFPARRAVASAGFDGGAKPLPREHALPASSPQQAPPAGTAAPGAPAGALAALRRRKRPLFPARDVVMALATCVWAIIPFLMSNAVIRRRPNSAMTVVRRRGATFAAS